VEGKRGWSEQRRKVIDTFHKAARMDNSLRLDLLRLQAQAAATKARFPELWQQAQQWATTRPPQRLHCSCCTPCNHLHHDRSYARLLSSRLLCFASCVFQW
jgi:hypothetical protein